MTDIGERTTESIDDDDLQRLIDRGWKMYRDAFVAMTGRAPDRSSVLVREVGYTVQRAARENSADAWNMGGQFLVAELMRETGRKL